MNSPSIHTGSSKRSMDENAETRHSVHINLFDDKGNEKGKGKCGQKKKDTTSGNPVPGLLNKRHSVHVNLFDKGIQVFCKKLDPQNPKKKI